MSKRYVPLWCEAHVEVNCAKKTERCGALLVMQVLFCVAGARDYAPCQSQQTIWRSCGIAESDGWCRTFEDDPEWCMSRGRRNTRDLFIRDVRRSGRWFLERGCALEHQIFRFANMILPDRCSTSHDLASLFHGRRNTLERWSGKIPKRVGTRPSALHSIFHLRTSGRIASFLLLSSSKIKDVSRHCFVLKLVKFEHKGSLAEKFRYQAYRQTDR